MVSYCYLLITMSSGNSAAMSSGNYEWLWNFPTIPTGNDFEEPTWRSNPEMDPMLNGWWFGGSEPWNFMTFHTY